ncbi:disabled 2, mitogen-responsive phosphoprotein [Cichlidogyrus casuarinus]|uniref:Disabled 2, mitogen-responsive phosphoprotein n=1 Tax=Cichlidogyrus casuarinus TaxID=1844966 RepID=A0ABD2PKE8_9PLAT
MLAEEPQKASFSMKGKFYGFIEVGEERGDNVCASGLTLLKMRTSLSKSHKKKVTITVSEEEILVSFHESEQKLQHPIEDISFVWIDPTDPYSWGLISKTNDHCLDHSTNPIFYAYKMEKKALKIVQPLYALHVIRFKDRNQDDCKEGKLIEIEGERVDDDLTKVFTH